MLTIKQKNRDIYKKLILKFGLDNQLIKLIEELSELQQEICKILIGERMEFNDNFIGELADVEIMLSQIHCLLSDERMKKLTDMMKIKHLKIEDLVNVSEN